MKRALLVSLFILGYSLLHGRSEAQTNPVFVAYYPSWCQNALGTTYTDKYMGLPPEDVNWDGINIVVHFGGAYPTTTPPYTNITYDPSTGLANTQKGVEYEYGNDIWNPGSGSNCGYDKSPPSPCPNWRHWQADLISTAHAHGVKVLFDIEAIGLTEHTNMYNLTQDANKTAVFANYTATYVNLRGYDGVQIDWEFFTDFSKTPSGSQMATLTNAFRQALGPNKLFIYAPVFTNWNSYPASMDSKVDYYVLQAYGYQPVWDDIQAANTSWYMSPLHKGTVQAGSEAQAWDSQGPLDWVSAGHDPSKIVPGVYSGAYVDHNVDGIYQYMGWDPAGEGDHWHADRLKTNGGTLSWDAVRMVPYIHGTAISTQGLTSWGQPGVSAGQKFFATFEDSLSIKAKVDWVNANHLGGIMVYNFSSDILDLRYGSSPRIGNTNPVHKWVAKALGSSNYPTGYITASPSVLQIGGGTTTLTWTSNNATSASIDQGIGSVALNGSTTKTVTSSTIFTLTLSNSYGSQTYSATVTVSGGPPVISGISTSNITSNAATVQWSTNVGSSSQVEYGPTTNYGSKTDSDIVLVTSHSVKLSNLAASTLYHYRVKSTEAAGYQAVSSDQTFTTAPPPPPSTIRSDDFNSSSLNTSIWTFVNPLHDATLSLVGTGTQDALLSISLPYGQSHDSWTGGNFAPRITQSANNTDFEVETKFQSTLNAGYQQPGVIVEQDSLNYLRFDFIHDGSNLNIYAATITGGTASAAYQAVINAGNPLYLRVKRQGDQWTQSYSYDGSTWTGAANFSHILTVTKVGVFVGNYGTSNNAPAFTGLIDYFFNTASPVAPEDGTAGVPSAPILSSPANGATGVAINPTVSWNASSGATSYGLQVSTSSTFSTTTVNRTGITTTSAAISGLGNNTTYYWRVNATSAGGTSTWSSTRSFTTVVGSTNHNIMLPAGWSMVSSFVQPSNLTLDSVFSKIKSHLEIVKNGAGQVFWPTYAINTIGNWDTRYGYQIYMQTADTLALTGSAISPETTPIPLVSGANLVAYLRCTPMRSDSSLTSIASSLVIVKNNAGEVYWPSYGINSIGSMKPGQGYQVQVTGASTLTYPANNGSTPPSILTKELKSSASISDVLSPNHYMSSVSNTGATAILLVQSPELSSGDEIAVWTSRRLLVGSGVMNQGKALITVWGDNSISETMDGAAKDELLSLTAWPHVKQREETLTFTSITDGLTGTPIGTTLRYKTDAVWVAEVTRAEQIPTAVTLFQNYPNPFNPSSVIKYGLPFTAMVSLEVYNILGQRVATLVNGEQQAGYHEVVFENSTLGSGVYFYRLSGNNFTITKKMMVVR
jgi:GH18 family chitinase/regulation of enolase protein 1 (concanavalin A-like superfamily)